MGVQGLKQYIFTMGYIRIDKGRKDTRILWRVSYRENGKVKKKEYLLSSKGKITYKLPMWYIFVGIIDRKEFESELVKYWLKVAMIEDYVNWEWQGQKLKFTSKSPHYDLRSKSFKELLQFVRQNVDIWHKSFDQFYSEVKKYINDSIDSLWYSFREFQDYEKQPLITNTSKDYVDYFTILVKNAIIDLRVNSNHFNLELVFIYLVFLAIGEGCSSKETDNEIKNENWIIKDNNLSIKRSALIKSHEQILKNIEVINNNYCPEKKENALELFKTKILENKTLPLI